MDVKIIDDKVLEFIKNNKGIIALGYVNSKGYPEVSPKFVVEISENHISFIESKKEVVEMIKNSKSVSVAIFDWTGKVADGYQLKGSAEFFDKNSPKFKEILSKFESKTLTPNFLNEFLQEMEENKIIPEKNFLVEIHFNIKYSLAPSPESAKPIVLIK